MGENLPLVLFGLTVMLTLVSCAAAVVAVMSARRPASAELAATVDECVSVVEKLMQQQRKLKMSHVRAQRDDDTPPQPAEKVPPSAEPMETKLQLLQLARQKGFRL